MEKLRPGDPEQLGPYTIIARLGSGGMGVVFLGSKGSKRVAVKVVRSSFLDNPSLRTRFEREIDTLKKLKSDHLAAYLDSDTEGELAWHAVEFINGPTLKERVEHEGPMSPDEWWDFYENLRTALSDIHSFGVTHRDLKPSNIILSETGLKLIDFGIAQDAEATSITTTGTVTGSPAWLSPEQLEGTELGPGSDLFSAGSILVYAAVGRSPWGEETTMTVPMAYQRILSRDFRLAALPQELREAVKPLFHEQMSNRAFSGAPATQPPKWTPRPEGALASARGMVSKQTPFPTVGTNQHVANNRVRSGTRNARTALGIIGGLGLALAASFLVLNGLDYTDMMSPEMANGGSTTPGETNIDAGELVFEGAANLDGTNFSLLIPGEYADSIETVTARIYDRQNRSVSFSASAQYSFLESCPGSFELKARHRASSDVQYFLRECGPPALDYGWVELEILRSDGNVSAHRLGF